MHEFVLQELMNAIRNVWYNIQVLRKVRLLSLGVEGIRKMTCGNRERGNLVRM